jgi:integrase
MIGPPATLLEFYEQVYIPARYPNPRQHRTRETCRGELRKFDREAAALLGCSPPLAALNAELLTQVMYRLVSRGQSPATANKLLAHVKCVWLFARKRKLLAAECDCEPYPTDRRAPVAFTAAEMQAVLAAIDRLPGPLTRSSSVSAAVFHRALWLFLYSTGARLGVTLKIPTANFNAERGLVTLPAAFQKHHCEQVLDLLDSSLAALVELGPGRRGIPLLFGDWPYRENPLRERFKAIQRLAGVPVAKRISGPHKLRKTLATDLAAVSGKHAACERLGHSHVRVTERFYLDPTMSTSANVRGVIADPFALRSTELTLVAVEAAAG